jgi:hypothetical protein
MTEDSMQDRYSEEEKKARNNSEGTNEGCLVKQQKCGFDSEEQRLL